jgi:hypothetical protein
MEYDTRWSHVVSLYLHKASIDSKYERLEQLNEARRRIKRSINYYERKGEALKFILDLMLGGIFIGCLPDRAFQEALATLSPLKIYSENPLGAISLLSSPFIGVFYSSRYGLPAIWMEQVISQIELELEE